MEWFDNLLAAILAFFASIAAFFTGLFSSSSESVQEVAPEPTVSAMPQVAMESDKTE